MNLAFTTVGWEHYIYWMSKDKKTHKKILALIKDALRNPEAGLGKPEPLKYGKSGNWSRRINKSDRFVYCIQDDVLWVVSLRGHYTD